MEKGTRDLPCGHCPPEKKTILRIKVTPSDYGKKVQVRCKICGGVNQVVIPTPANVQEPEKKPTGAPFGGGSFGDAFGDIFGDMFKKK